jgi:hypothetical protein
MTAGHGLDIAERPVTPEEAGQPLQAMGVPVVVRQGKLLHYNQPEVAEVGAGDVLVFVASLDAAAGRS